MPPRQRTRPPKARRESLPAPLTLDGIAARLAPHRLVVMGGFAVTATNEDLPKGSKTLLLIGPAGANIGGNGEPTVLRTGALPRREGDSGPEARPETSPEAAPGTDGENHRDTGPGFWQHLTQQPEWRDGRPDPLDRWSRRVIGRIACDLRAKALFPFGGPPWRPFYRWALRSGHAWESPVRFLVHDRAGLWTSYRGALALRQQLDLPPASTAPCATCATQPCLTACPAGALTAAGYDLPRCHDWLDQPQGCDCLTRGCLVRRACPLSQNYGRLDAQSAYHMSQFHR